MQTKEIQFQQPAGLEARFAALLIQKAGSFKSGIWIEKAERKANAKSLLGLLSLGIRSGDQIVISADGEDEKAAMEELQQFLLQL